MVAERKEGLHYDKFSCSLAKISMVAEQLVNSVTYFKSCSLAKISMVAELFIEDGYSVDSCSLAKISMVAEHRNVFF